MEARDEYLTSPAGRLLLSRLMPWFLAVLGGPAKIATSVILYKYLDSQVAQNNRSLQPKVDHYWFKVAHNYKPLALQVQPTKNLQEQSLVPIEATREVGEENFTMPCYNIPHYILYHNIPCCTV